jgi:hypothetical protein
MRRLGSFLRRRGSSPSLGRNCGGGGVAVGWVCDLFRMRCWCLRYDLSVRIWCNLMKKGLCMAR